MSIIGKLSTAIRDTPLHTDGTTIGHVIHADAERSAARAVLAVLADRSIWPMDDIADRLDAAGIDQPRPSDVLTAFFGVLLTE